MKLKNARRWDSRRSTSAAVFSLGILTALILGGCTSMAPSTSTTAQKNIEQWTMPLDPYQQNDRTAAEYAELLLDRPCMIAAGYSWDVPYEDTSLRSPTTNSIDVRLMTTSTVSNWGYHPAKTILPNASSWQKFEAMTNSLSVAEFSKLRNCQAAARKKIPIVDDQSNYAAGLASGSIDTAMKKPLVIAAAAAWHRCMLPAGISDLPATPEGMPTPSQITEYDIANPTSTAGPDEITAATKDLNCRVSSGYRQKEYNAVWAAQLVLLDKYRDQLDRNKAVLDSAAKKVANEIATHAPSS